MSTIDEFGPFQPVHLPARIEADVHNLFMHLLYFSGKKVIVTADTQEYADAVLRLLEGLYPGAGELITFDIQGRPPGTTG